MNHYTTQNCSNTGSIGLGITKALKCKQADQLVAPADDSDWSARHSDSPWHEPHQVYCVWERKLSSGSSIAIVVRSGLQNWIDFPLPSPIPFFPIILYDHLLLNCLRGTIEKHDQVVSYIQIPYEFKLSTLQKNIGISLFWYFEKEFGYRRWKS